MRGWLALAIAGSAGAGTPLEHPWNDRSLPAGERAELALGGMTDEEKLSLVHGVIAAPWGGEGKPIGAVGSAGYVAGVPRLGIPALQETDAELGVANPGNIRRGDAATAMPSDLALASTWDLALARRQGEAVGAEARAKGFNVLLGGAANLIRDPRGGRNFEYFSEDPLLTGLMAGAVIDGVQSGPIISTVKHFALNAQETDRVVLDARIDPAAARESDLLAFEIAIERGRPGSVMCAYNQVNGVYSCENEWLSEPGAEGRLALSGLRHVGLGGGSFHGSLGLGGARSGIRRAARHAKFLCRRPAPSDRRRRSPAGPARRHGAANPDVDVRSWALRQERRLRACRFRGERSRPRWPSSGRARFCCETRASCLFPPRRGSSL